MPKLHIIAVGRLKSGPLKDTLDEYTKRITYDLKIHELDVRDGAAREHTTILNAMIPGAFTIVLDERGKTMSSPALAKLLQTQIDSGARDIQFIIGGADGLNDDIRAKASHILSFGAMTWPHMLARVMLAEQIYRAQTIIAGHPYHRE